MNNVYVLGNTIDDLGSYFYALRRDDDGNLFINRIDNLNDLETVDLFGPEVNADFVGKATEDYFGERDDATRLLEYSTDDVKYEQWKWENLKKFYYLNEDGELVVSVGTDKLSRLE